MIDIERKIAEDVRTWHRGPIDIQVINYRPYAEPLKPSKYAGNLTLVGEIEVTYDGYHRALYGLSNTGAITLYAN